VFYRYVFVEERLPPRRLSVEPRGGGRGGGERARERERERESSADKKILVSDEEKRREEKRVIHK